MYVCFIIGLSPHDTNSSDHLLLMNERNRFDRKQLSYKLNVSPDERGPMVFIRASKWRNFLDEIQHWAASLWRFLELYVEFSLFPNVN